MRLSCKCKDEQAQPLCNQETLYIGMLTLRHSVAPQSQASMEENDLGEQDCHLKNNPSFTKHAQALIAFGRGTCNTVDATPHCDRFVAQQIMQAFAKDNGHQAAKGIFVGTRRACRYDNHHYTLARYCTNGAASSQDTASIADEFIKTVMQLCMVKPDSVHSTASQLLHALYELQTLKTRHHQNRLRSQTTQLEVILKLPSLWTGASPAHSSSATDLRKFCAKPDLRN